MVESGVPTLNMQYSSKAHYKLVTTRLTVKKSASDGILWKFEVWLVHLLFNTRREKNSFATLEDYKRLDLLVKRHY